MIYAVQIVKITNLRDEREIVRSTTDRAEAERVAKRVARFSNVRESAVYMGGAGGMRVATFKGAAQ